MHHGNGPTSTPRQLQRSRSFTGNEGEEATMQTSLPQSPAPSFTPAVSSPAPQSPSYQIQQLIMSRNPVAGQNVNITLQNVGPVVAGNQQITLTPLPIPNPASPGFQFSSQPRRFEHGSPSYIQVTSPMSQQVQTQSPTQPSAMPIQALQSVRTGTAGASLSMCSQSPTRGFVDASVLVRQISLSPSNGGHFVFQEGTGIAQIAQGATAQVQLPAGATQTTMHERRLSQPHSQTGGTIHHLGPQSPVASGANMQALATPSHITTTNLPPQISSIIQGQLIQQQQVLHGQQLGRAISFDRTAGGMIAGVAGASFGMSTPPTPTSPSRAAGPQGLSNLLITTTVSTTHKKQSKKLEEIPPATQEDARMRKQCLDHHQKNMKALKENFKEYLIELFFLQHFQGNMMDFLAFKKKPALGLQGYLRQNDLDVEEEEEEEQSEVINDEVKIVTGKDGQTGTPVAIATQLPPNVSAAFSSQQQPFQQALTGSGAVGAANTIDIEAFKRQQVLTQTDPSKRPRLDVPRHGMVFQHPGVTSGVPLQQLMPTAQGGMPPTPQTVQLTGQKQNQQQYDPSKGPPVQNAASLHTPPPQLPSRVQASNIPISSLPTALHLAQQQQQQQQQQITETQIQPQIQVQVKSQPASVQIPASPQNQLPSQISQPLQSGFHTQMQTAVSQPQAAIQQQTVTLVRPGIDSPQQRLTGNTQTNAFVAPAAISTANPIASFSLPTNRALPATSKSMIASVSKAPGSAGTAGTKIQGQLQILSGLTSENSQDKLAEQVKLENHVHQRIADLRKEGLWSLRRLPKIQEPSRAKSHWDYLLEEMQWMAADFAQERMWKQASAKKLVRKAARYHEEKKVHFEMAQKEEENKLKRIASSIAREIEYFWSNIEQVVEIKLQMEFQEKRRKALNLNTESMKGPLKAIEEACVKQDISKSPCTWRKRKASSSWSDGAVEDEEETIAEQESKEGNIDHHAELCELAREADLPLDDLVKQYEGAYDQNFHWPQTLPQSKESNNAKNESEEATMESVDSQNPTVLIDFLPCADQYRTADVASSGHLGSRKHTRDIGDVARAAELLLPNGIARITSTEKKNPPCLLHGSLRDYQQVGLDWLEKQYKKNLNGILADETGLGKNIQVIALMAHLASSEGNWGPHLIVVRSCKILKWELEFKRWCPGLKLLLYFGKQRELRKKRQKWDEPNNFNVCITSYKHLFKSHQTFMKKRWKYLVLDEVHQIKNMTEKHWDAVFKLPSQNRLLLRDTPLMNTWRDHWTMVHFLIPKLSQPYLDFPLKISTEENQENCHKLFITLHRTVRPFILRRSKKDVEKQLTKKYEHVLKCRLSNRQKALYEDVILQPGTQDALKGGHFVSVLHVLMQLQRICNHPDLVDPRPEHSSYLCDTLQYRTASLILRGLERNPWKNTDVSLFDLFGVEDKMTRYEVQLLPAQKVTRKQMEEIYCSSEPTPRPTPVKMKPSRLFQPVQYGQKPEGRTVTFSNVPSSRMVTTTTATVTQQGQARGRSPVTTASCNQGGDVVKIAQLGASGGTQGRIAQPKTPVTLQFQGNTFTLSQSQLRQLTAGQPLQLQGSVLQIVSAPGQPYLRPPGQMIMQTVPQSGAIQNAINALGNQIPAGMSCVTSAQQTGIPGRTIMPHGCVDPSVALKSSPTSLTPAQEFAEEKQRLIKERLDRLFSSNERNCGRAPVYGADLLSICCLNPAGAQPSISESQWGWAGFANCLRSSRLSDDTGDPLHHLILSSCQDKAAQEFLTKRTLCVVPAVIAAPPVLMMPHAPPQYTHSMNILRDGLKEQVAPHLHHLLKQTSPHCMQFPDLRLIQWDSGKLDALAVLLRKLRSEGRRVLIFSQMLLMLDILELFLDFHSLTFLRIDEFASYDQCYDLMKSFNQDPRIFCLLISTHSHSLGVPYVEANTAIFYDSDLNPVMDSKAQAWCDRIGRTKDVHIYRLVSANSIEEKLLKNGTKDLIREVAAQGNDFSMAFLTQQTIHELFELYSPLEDTGFGEKAEEFIMLSQEPSHTETIATKFAKPFIEALKSIEHGAEQEEEFSEAAALGEQYKKDFAIDGCCSSIEASELMELAAVVEQLTPIEKYALNYLEEFYTSSANGKAEIIEQLKSTKSKWEVQNLKETKEWEEDMVLEESGEDLLTYTREDAYNKEFIYDSPDGQTEIMPIWTPPTPPQDENDIYIDSVMCLMYDSNPIPESKLPPVYVRKERKRHKTDPGAAGRKKKQRHGESVVPPRSLFDRATPGMLKVRREGKEQKKNILLKQQTQFAKPLPTLVKPATESGPDNPEWLISEDWALLQAVKHLLELPLNLTVVSPAHTPNWDLVSDVVNSCSRIYRSSKQCRSRYENVIIPREEGKLMFEANPKKKTKSIYKTKNSRPLRTSQIYAQDEGVTHTQLYNNRFELMKMTAGKRSPPIKPLLGMNPFQKNPKHASVLAESGINYDKPLPPIQVASLRAERIAKEKKALVEQHHRAQQQTGSQTTQQSQQNGQQASSPVVQPTQAQPQQVVQQQVIQQSQPVVPTATSAVPATAVLAGAIKTTVTGASIQAAAVSGNGIVNTVAGVPSATFQPINKRLASPVIPGTLTAPSGSQQVVHTQQRAATASAAPAEMVTIATNQGVRALTPVTGGTVVCSSITPAQTRPIVTQVTTATTAGVQLASKAMTPAQLQMLRQQQAAQVQVPQIQAQTQSPGQIKAVGKISQEQLLKLQKQKMQLPQQITQATAQQSQPGAPPAAPVQGQQQPQQTQAQQQTQQLAAVTAPRAGAVLTGATVANLQVARLLQTQGQIQTQPGQAAQVTLTKPPVVSAVVSSAGVTTLPVTVAGISVAIGQNQKAAGGQAVVAQPLNVQQLLKLKQQQQQQKALQSQAATGQVAVQQPKITAPQVAIQAQQQQSQQQGQQQKVTYAAQPAIKTQFLAAPMNQAQKSPGAQQMQAQLQVAKLPQVVQQQTAAAQVAVANIPQMVPASQQVPPQTMTLTQATAAGQQQVQVLPAGSAAAQAVQQKMVQQQQQVVSSAQQIQASVSQSTTPALGANDTQAQQAKLQVRTPTVRIKAPTKPS